MTVNIRAIENVNMLELDHEVFEKMVDEFDGFKKKVLLY